MIDNNLGWSKTTLSFLKIFTITDKSYLSSIISDLFLLEKNKEVHIQMQPKTELEMEITVSYSNEKKDNVFDILLKIENVFTNYK